MTRNILLAVIACLCLFIAFQAGHVYAQSGAVIYLQSTAGTTLTNCGTPATPSICVVGSGVAIWQNSTDGWFVPQKSTAVASVQKVNGISPDATGNVTVPLPTTASVTLAGQTLTGTVK